MRVMLSEDFPPRDGGLSTWAYQLVKNINRLDGPMVVITRGASRRLRLHDRGHDFPVWRMAGHDWRRFGYLYIAYYLFKFFLFQGHRPVIYATRWKEGLVPALLAPLLSLKVIIAAHGNDIIKKKSAYRGWLFRRTFNRSHAAVAVSRYTAEALADQGVHRHKVVFIPNGVDTSVFRPQEKSADLIRRYGLQGKKVLMTLARLVPRKGQDQVIRALPEVSDAVPEAVYLIAGRGRYEKELRTLARSVGVQDHVIFAGFVAPDELVAHYNLADIYIMPSREIARDGSVEGFGITFLEANACGVPVIGGRSGGIPDAVVDGETGLLVNPLDSGDIAAAIVRLLTDDDYARRLGHGGRERVLRELQWEQIARRFLRLEGPRRDWTL
jgi:phosphatidylinositol alpha-1,6-mannosyltransferase